MTFELLPFFIYLESPGILYEKLQDFGLLSYVRFLSSNIQNTSKFPFHHYYEFTYN